MLRMYRRVAALLFAALLLACTTTGERSGRVVVTVVDARCGYAGARVSATATHGERAEAIADANGNATFVLQPGEWRFVPFLEGAYAAESVSVMVAVDTEPHAEAALDFESPGAIVIEPHGPCRSRVRNPAAVSPAIDQ